MANEQTRITRKRTQEIIDDEEDLPKSPDGGWGWVVVIASFIILFFTKVKFLTIMMGHLLKSGDNSNNRYQGIETITVMLLDAGSYILGPLFTMLVTRFGFRITTIVGSLVTGLSIFINFFFFNKVLYLITVGIIAGIGIGLINFSVMVAVTLYFERYRAIMIGVILCGSNISIFTMQYFSPYIFEHFDWKILTSIFSVSILLCAFIGILLKPLTSTYIEDNYNEAKQVNLISTNNIKNEFYQMISLFKRSTFLLFSGSTFLILFGIYFTEIFYFEKILSLDMKMDDIRILLSLPILSNIIGCALFALIYSIPKVNKLWIFALVVIIGGVVNITAPFCHNFILLATYAVIKNIANSGSISMISVILVDLFGLKKFTSAYGLIMFYQGITAITQLIFNFVGIHEIQDSKIVIFHILVGILWIISGMMLLSIPFIQKKQMLKYINKNEILKLKEDPNSISEFKTKYTVESINQNDQKEICKPDKDIEENPKADFKENLEQIFISYADSEDRNSVCDTGDCEYKSLNDNIKNLQNDFEYNTLNDCLKNMHNLK